MVWFYVCVILYVQQLFSGSSLSCLVFDVLNDDKVGSITPDYLLGYRTMEAYVMIDDGMVPNSCNLAKLHTLY